MIIHIIPFNDDYYHCYYYYDYIVMIIVITITITINKYIYIYICLVRLPGAIYLLPTTCVCDDVIV